MPVTVTVNNLALSVSNLGSFIMVPRIFPHQPMQWCKFYRYHLLQMITLQKRVLQMISNTLFSDVEIPIINHIAKMRVHTRLHQLKLMKSGLEFFILEFSKPFQSCYCPVQKKSAQKG